MSLKGAGESTLHMSKQFALDQSGGDRTTVDLYQRTTFTQAPVVNCARDQLFPGSRFTVDEHARISGSDLVYSSQQVQQRCTVAHNLLEVMFSANLLLKIDILFLEPCLQGSDLFV